MKRFIDGQRALMICGFAAGFSIDSVGLAQREWDSRMGRAKVGASGEGHGLGAPVDALEIYDGKLLAGGSFDGALSNGNDIAGLAQWNEIAGVWQQFEGGVYRLNTDGSTFFGSVHDLASFNVGSSTRLIVIGDFDAVGVPPNRVMAKNVAIWNGTNWQNVSSGLLTPGQYVRYLRVASLPQTFGESTPLLLARDIDSNAPKCGENRPESPTTYVFRYLSASNSWVPTTSSSSAGTIMQGGVDDWSGFDVLNLPPEFGGSQAHLGISGRQDCWNNSPPRGAAKLLGDTWSPYTQEIAPICTDVMGRGPELQVVKFTYFETLMEQSIYFGGVSAFCAVGDGGRGPLVRLPLGSDLFEEIPLQLTPMDVYAIQPWSSAGCGDGSTVRLWVGGAGLIPLSEPSEGGRVSALWSYSGGSAGEWNLPTPHELFGISNVAPLGTTIPLVRDIIVFQGDLIVAGDFGYAGSRRYDNVVRLTCKPVCRLDFDGDGFVTGDDFDAFSEKFVEGDIEADYDQNGFVSGDDFDAFVLGFENGC